jgi:hypothetical protein
MTSTNKPFIGFCTESIFIAKFVEEKFTFISNAAKKIVNPNKRDNVFNLTYFNEEAQKICKTIYYDGCIGINRKINNSKTILEWKRPNGMKKIRRKSWTFEEDAYIVNNSIENSSMQLGRSEQSIKSRLWRIK